MITSEKLVSDSKSYEDWVEKNGDEKENLYKFRNEDGHDNLLPLRILTAQFNNARVLFRGQTSIYSNLKPSLYRGLQFDNERSIHLEPRNIQEFILRSSNTFNFIREMQHHPLLSLMDIIGMRPDKLALSQHYGMPTRYVDITHSYSVACFFATCRLIDDRWEPMTKGNGMFYEFVPLLPYITQQVFMFPTPRPTEQRAWVLDVNAATGQSKENVGYAFGFEHDIKSGEYFLEKFQGGDLLFPEEPLADVAKQITSNGTIYEEDIISSIQQLGLHGLNLEKSDQLSILNSMRNKHDVSNQSPTILTKDKLEKYHDQISDEIGNLFSIKFNKLDKFQEAAFDELFKTKKIPTSDRLQELRRQYPEDKVESEVE